MTNSVDLDRQTPLDQCMNCGKKGTIRLNCNVPGYFYPIPQWDPDGTARIALVAFTPHDGSAVEVLTWECIECYEECGPLQTEDLNAMLGSLGWSSPF